MDKERIKIFYYLDTIIKMMTQKTVKVKKTALLLFYWLPIIGIGQTVTLSPNPFEENREITITVSDFEPQASWSVPDIYLWAWYFDENEEFAGNSSATGSDFSNSPETAKFTDNGDGTYSYSFTPTTF